MVAGSCFDGVTAGSLGPVGPKLLIRGSMAQARSSLAQSNAPASSPGSWNVVSSRMEGVVNMRPVLVGVVVELVGAAQRPFATVDADSGFEVSGNRHGATGLAHLAGHLL